METLPARVLDTRDVARIQRKAALATALMAIAVVAWAELLTPAIAESPRRTAIPRAIFQIGQYLCQRNDGLESIEAYPLRPQVYGVRCADGAMFPDQRMVIAP